MNVAWCIGNKEYINSSTAGDPGAGIREAVERWFRFVTVTLLISTFPLALSAMSKESLLTGGEGPAVNESVQPDSTNEWVITIHAGHLNRTQTPVWVSFPFPIEDGVYSLRQTAMTNMPTGGMQRGEAVRRPAERLRQQRPGRQPGQPRPRGGMRQQDGSGQMQPVARWQQMQEAREQMQRVGPNHPVPEVIQVEDQRGLLVLPFLPAGRSVELAMSLDPVGVIQQTGDQTGTVGEANGGDIRHEMGETRLSFSKGDRPLFSYLHEMEPVPAGVETRHTRGGYIYPLYTPSGRNVVKHFNDGRPHQYALWSTWYRTEVDGELVTFWSSLEEDGRVRPQGVQHVSEGPVAAHFVAKNRYFDLVPQGDATRHVTEPFPGDNTVAGNETLLQDPVLNETWQVTMVPDLGRTIQTPSGNQQRLMNGNSQRMGGNSQQSPSESQGPGRYHILDIVLTQEVAGEKQVKILEGGYGGISLRGPDEWNQEGAMTFLSSEGHHRNTVQNEPIRWGQLYGELEGEMAGIAILAAPPSTTNPLHPGAPMGGFINQSAEPFFSLGPAALGEFLITPGTPWQAHYRVVVHDGELPARVLDRIWNDLASPPVVEVSRR